MHSNIQMGLGIKTEIKITLEKPLFFNTSKLKCGTLSQLALPKGQHTLTAIYKHGLVHQVQDQDGFAFEVELVNKKGVFYFKGTPKNIETPNQDNILINGAGPSGKSLRKAQVGAIYSLLAHWSISNAPATIVLPTGTGKTETMLVATLADNAKKTLVVVPYIDLKVQITEKYLSWGILRSLGVISPTKHNPNVLMMTSTIKDIKDLDTADVIITTPSLIARADTKVKNKLKDAFSHVFFDEAHHIAASEWNTLKTLFNKAKIVQFTATPYRNDRKPVEGKIVYNYSLSQALIDNCFSKISLISVDERNPKLKDKAIAEAAMKRLQQDRDHGWVRHKMMVRTEKREHAEELYLHYKEWFPNERIIAVHSGTKGKKVIIEKIKKGEYDIVICVDMLKEGFDFPDFKIAAVHKLHKSLGVLLQFVGRFARTQEGLGDASFIVNFADENLSIELENLLQEGSGWENVISEIADERKANAESLLSFLQGCEPYSGFDSPNIELNPKLVYPALSCVCFRSHTVNWKRFKDAFSPKVYALSQPYYNSHENVFYFTTQKREKVKWARTDKMRDQTWNLVVMHFDKKSKLLYIGYSEKLLDTHELVKCITNKEPNPLNGDCVFRAFDSIKRLSIVHAGIFKPANHLHRYSRLSGADVTTELTKWKEGTRCQKSDFVGIGFRNGFPVSVGASVKGKIWSPSRVGDLKEWKSWCLDIGSLITNETINSNQLLEDSAEKKELNKYPEDITILAADWTENLYDRIHKLTVTFKNTTSIMLSECTLKCKSAENLKADFVLSAPDNVIDFSITLGGEKGHIVEGLDNTKVSVEGLKAEPISLKKFFEENPPTIFLLNGCTISGCIHTKYNTDIVQKIPVEQIEQLPWEDVSYNIESMYKKEKKRDNSIQEYMMKRLVSAGAKIVFNDDNSGESADIVAIFVEDDIIRFELVHCKYSKKEAGSRSSDLFEVCGQAIISLRYKWKPEELLKHMERRNGTGVLKGKRFYHGNSQDVETVRKALRYTNVSFEFGIAQPGVSELSTEMMNFLGSIYSTVVEMTETKLKCYFNS